MQSCRGDIDESRAKIKKDVTVSVLQKINVKEKNENRRIVHFFESIESRVCNKKEKEKLVTEIGAIKPGFRRGANECGGFSVCSPSIWVETPKPWKTSMNGLSYAEIKFYVTVAILAQ